MHTCEWWDSGYCFAPKDLATTADNNGACGGLLTCPQAKCPELPPINLNVLPSADVFYTTTAPREIEDAFREDDDAHH